MFHVKQLDAYRDLLLRWSGSLNLSSNDDSTASGFDRHISDSLCALPFLPSGLDRLVDLGSGQGFPAIPIAIMTGVAVDLIESDRRKAAFLTTAIATLGIAGRVWPCRIEHALAAPAACVTARALAPLDRLLSLARRFVRPEGCCLFFKGLSVSRELEAAAEVHRFMHTVHPIGSGRSNLVKITNFN